MTNQPLTDQELAQLLRKKAANIQLSAAERQGIKYTLMENITTGGVTKLTNPRYNRWTYQVNFRGVAMPFLPILFAILLAGGVGTAALADNAVPGDALYGLDQWMERIQARATTSEGARTRLYGRFNQERLTELEALRNVDPSQLNQRARERWEGHHQEAVERLAKSIEQLTALQERFQEKLESADTEAQKTAFQQVLDHLSQVKERREERVDQMEGREFPGMGQLPVMQRLHEWQNSVSDEVREQIREQIRNEFGDPRGMMGAGQNEIAPVDATGDSVGSQTGTQTQTQTQTRTQSGAQSGVTAQAIEARIPIDYITGEIDWDKYDTDHDGIPDKYDPLPNWPPHTM